MDFGPIFVTAIVFVTIYKIFDLFVRRRERLAIIDKLTPENANLDFSKLAFPERNTDNRFTVLKWALLALGFGLGLFAYVMFVIAIPNFRESYGYYSEYLCGGLIFTGGGLGLLISFIIENALRKNR